MLSLPPSGRTPESQLTAEQSLTGRHWNSPKKIPHIQRQRRSTMRWQEGCNHNNIKSPNCWVGDSKTGEHLCHRNPPTGVKVLSPTSGFPTWGSGNGRRNSQRIRLRSLAGFDCRTLTGLGEQKLHSWRAHTKQYAHRDPGEGAVTPQETEPNLSASVGGPPAEVGGGCVSP